MIGTCQLVFVQTCRSCIRTKYLADMERRGSQLMLPTCMKIAIQHQAGGTRKKNVRGTRCGHVKRGSWRQGSHEDAWPDTRYGGTGVDGARL